MRGWIVGVGAACAAVAMLVLPGAARADEPDLLALGAGAYNVLHRDKEAQLRLEYRFSYRLLQIVQPVLGVLATDRGTLYGYGGIRIDLVIANHFVIMPEAAVGYWHRGGGKDLGAAIEFKTGGEIAYRFDDASRLGIAFDHISNAGIGKNNPGVESLLLVYSIPIGGAK